MRTHQTTSERMERKTKKEMLQKRVLQHLLREEFSIQDIELDMQVRQLSVLGIIGGACSGCEPSRNG